MPSFWSFSVVYYTVVSEHPQGPTVVEANTGILVLSVLTARARHWEPRVTVKHKFLLRAGTVYSGTVVYEFLHLFPQQVRAETRPDETFLDRIDVLSVIYIWDYIGMSMTFSNEECSPNPKTSKNAISIFTNSIPKS